MYKPLQFQHISKAPIQYPLKSMQTMNNVTNRALLVQSQPYWHHPLDRELSLYLCQTLCPLERVCELRQIRPLYLWSNDDFHSKVDYVNGWERWLLLLLYWPKLYFLVFIVSIYRNIVWKPIHFGSCSALQLPFRHFLGGQLL